MFQFTNSAAHRFKEGMLYLGRDPKTGHDIGIETERAALAIAGAGAGKNAALQVPNLLRWPHNVINIDPSGGNVELVWEAREAMGQTVAVFDPFKAANIPDRLRLGCNLLAAIDPESLTAREDIRVIADGLVMRHDPRHSQWADARVDVIAGAIAHVITTAPPEFRTFADVRALLSLPSHSDDDGPSPLEAMFTEMRGNPACGGLAQHGAAIGLAALKSKSGDSPTGAAVSGALSDTKWIDSPAMLSALTGSLDLSTLKNDNVSIFLVLPPQYLDEHGRFLRLFVLASLQAMMKGGVGGKTCLFMLDEFFSLGYLQIVEKAAGLMRKYGVILWPFLQDLGQLVKLYGPHGAQTFFGNADAHIFFGNTDTETLQVISNGIGNLTTDEIGPAPTHFQGVPINGGLTRALMAPASSNKHAQQSAALMGGLVGAFGASANALGQWAAQAEMAAYQQKAAMVGRPRVPPETVRELVAKHSGDAVARSMIVFAKGGHILNLRLVPYFEKQPVNAPTHLTVWGKIDGVLSVAAVVFMASVFVIVLVNLMAHAEMPKAARLALGCILASGLGLGWKHYVVPQWAKLRK